MGQKAERGSDEQGGLVRRIERRSIDYVPEDERHGKVCHRGPRDLACSPAVGARRDCCVSRA